MGGLGAVQFSGAVCVFRAKRPDRVKLVFWDGTGVVLGSKPLEDGEFRWPKIEGGALRLAAAQLQAVFEGLNWRRVHEPQRAGHRPPRDKRARKHLTSIIESASWPRSPRDSETLQAMLIAWEAETERLRQIIKELQRHRFGRRAETLAEDQLLLGLEEAEQVEAAGFATSEETAPAEKVAQARQHRICRGSKRC